jgi:hypothetical protein
MLAFLGWIFFYALWIKIIHFFSLTVITFFHASSTANLQDIAETLRSNGIHNAVFSAFSFVCGISLLKPWASEKNILLSLAECKKHFFPSWLQGAFLAFGLIGGLLLSHHYQYLEFFTQLESTPEEAPIALASILTRVFVLFVFCYCETYFFFHKLKTCFPQETSPWITGSCIISAYCGMKYLQFDLGILQGISFFSMGIALFFRSQTHILQASGFLTGILVIFHPLCSLPIFGNECSGLFLLQMQPLGSVAPWVRSFVGESEGPFSGLLFPILLVFDTIKSLTHLRNNLKKEGTDHDAFYGST